MPDLFSPPPISESSFASSDTYYTARSSETYYTAQETLSQQSQYLSQEVEESVIECKGLEQVPQLSFDEDAVSAEEMVVSHQEITHEVMKKTEEVTLLVETTARPVEV